MVHRAIANMMNSLTKSQGSPAGLGCIADDREGFQGQCRPKGLKLLPIGVLEGVVHKFRTRKILIIWLINWFFELKLDCLCFISKANFGVSCRFMG